MKCTEFEKYEKTCKTYAQIGYAPEDAMSAFRENVIKRQKLNAAAPDMLEALQAILASHEDCLDDDREVLAKITAAIAKATK